jgi:sulfur-oxidizing protein SoxY
MLFAAVFVCGLDASAADAGLIPTRQSLDTMRWADLRQEYFAGAVVSADARVRVVAPAVAEDSMNVPVSVSIEGLPGVQKIIVLADYNPIVKVLEFTPGAARASLGFRVKLQQSTPIRALALTSDGQWHMGGTWVEASGGGCTAPSTGRSAGDWRDMLGQVNGRIFPVEDGSSRLRFRVQHPMDTGLAPGIPAFFMQQLAVLDQNEKELMRIQPFEPVSENPVFTIEFDGKLLKGLIIRGVDNNGNKVNSKVGS